MKPFPSSSNTQKMKFSQSSSLLNKTETKQKKDRITRNPLRELNSRSSARSVSSSNSSASTSVSGEAQKGCVRSLLSHSSSSYSMKTPFGSKPVKSLPKSAPVVNARLTKPLSKSRPALSKENSLYRTVSEKPILQKPHKCKKNPTLLHQGQSGKRPTSKSALKFKNNLVLSKLSSGSGEVKQKEHETVGRRDENDAHLTPVTKVGRRSGMDRRVTDKVMDDDRSKTNSSNTKTPPVQASVSPEIQCGSSILLSTTIKTPACYAAGYIVSGVSDKRKCRPKGILTVGNIDLDFGKAKSLNDFDDSDGGENAVRDSSTSMMPLPADASMHWLLSPCDEEKKDANEHSDDDSCQLQKLVGCEGPETPSRLSDLGFSSDICNISSSRSISIDNSGKGMMRRSISSLSPSELSEFGRFMDPLHDDGIVSCLQHATRTCQAAPYEQLKEERKHRYEPGEENSPFSSNTLGSENVIQTPESDSSSDRYAGLSWLEDEGLKKHHGDLDLKSLTTSLQAASFSPKSQVSICGLSNSSFRFDSLTTNSGSIDLSHFQRVLGDRNSCHSNLTSDNMAQSHMQISWKDGLNRQLIEMDKFDSCRCFSDEDENGNDSNNDQVLESRQGPSTDFDVGNDLMSVFGSAGFVDKEHDPEGENKEMVQTVFPSSSAESISTDGGGLVCSEDSDWMACYRNQFSEE